ncbi:hypothetical protein [Peribacillus acanthi]|uniref:hypothetical protein n=1 Tax=Peribacillus acanthi TaxID=2171554 RepID=UPI000D3ED6F7|nr:hypothetical protein [Peribacillus acanthi]
MYSFYDFENLKALVLPYSDKAPYYRPFLLHGELQQVDIFLVGINPATSVYPSEVNIETWINTIVDYRLYNRDFSSKGSTRRGINGFLTFVKKHYTHSLIETNFNSYPTSKAEQLAQSHIRQEVEEGEKRFIKVIEAHEPALIILHGQQTITMFMDMLKKKNWKPSKRLFKKTPIEDRETQFPHFTFQYSSGKIAQVFSCRHLQYFGNKGDSYKEFLDGLTPFIMTLAKSKE